MIPLRCAPELKKVKAELNRQIQINGSQAARGKKKKGGK